MESEKSEVETYKDALEEIEKVSDSYDRRPQVHLKKSSPFWRGKFEGLHICAKIARIALNKFRKG